MYGESCYGVGSVDVKTTSHGAQLKTLPMIRFPECETTGMTIYTYNLPSMDLRGRTGTRHASE